MEQKTIKCGDVGEINVYVQGNRSSNEKVIFTVHDLGCNYLQYDDFINHERMQPIRDRTVWVHVAVPGQETDASDLPSTYSFPTMQKLGESLIHILDELKIKEVLCFGEGAGANILARFACKHSDRVMGVVLLHCTGTTAGLMESLKDKVINWKLEHIGMNPTAEQYLVLHRFGSSSSKFNTAENAEQLKQVIANFQEELRQHVNPKNLKKFVEAFLKRTSIADKITHLKCPMLLVTGQKSVFSGTTNSLAQTVSRHASVKDLVNFIEVKRVANVLEEAPEKMAESFQYFIQGLGWASGVPMPSNPPITRNRSMSMEEYDLPLRMRSTSGGGSSCGSPTCV
ncbi:DgyrCDS6935 [Dimorphilus gyrociliatus]|uniref:DgyrCDS6935 n=1 Tax=Dimorphilus gyrociliatus TaxID=2664684 RepID=A0A7I8VPJ0_9ANNE|nr:DgyrCDS6935 [Dimorphilus gyrociliatus]